MIIFKNVSKTYEGKKRKVEALKNIDIAFTNTGLNFILGQSGAGKSTLLNILSLQDIPTSGEVYVDGNSISTFDQKALASLRCRYFGIIFQELNLIEDFSVYENIAIGMQIMNVTPSKEEVLNILKKFNLSENIIDERVCFLSGGQKQRVAIARTLIKKPKVIICDEPTGSLDEENAIEIMEILKEVARDKLVIVVSHNTDLANTFADRVIKLNDGSIVDDNNPITILDEEIVVMDTPSTHFPMKTIGRLSYFSFKKAFLKTIFTVITFVISLTVAMFALSLYLFDANKAIAETFKRENVTHFKISKTSGSGYGEEVPFNESDIDLIYEFFAGKCVVITDGGDIRCDFDDEYGSNMNFGAPTQGAHLTLENLNSFGFELYGRLPIFKENGMREIALSLYDCYLLGWLTVDDIKNEQLINEIISNKIYEITYENYQTGKKIIVEYDIVGLIDTNFHFVNIQEADINSDIISAQIYEEMHRCLFYSKDDFELISDYYAIYYHLDVPKYYQHIYVATEDSNYFKFNKLLAMSYNTFKAETRIDTEIFEFKNLSKTFGKPALLVTLFLLIISFFSFLGFLVSSITSDKRTIQILRSLGITKLDSIKTYLFQASIISMVCIILSTIPYTIAVKWFCRYKLSDSMLSVYPFYVNYIAIIVIFIGMLLISLCTTIILVGLIFHKEKITVEQ